MDDGAVAKRFGAKRVLADSFKTRARGDGRVYHLQQQQEGGRDGSEDKIVG